MTRLNEYGLRVNLTKCKWLQATVDFLRFEISPERIQPIASKFESLIESQPRKIESQPIKGKRRNKSNLLLKTIEPTYDWFHQHSETFSKLKQALSKSVFLHLLPPDTTLSLTTDASKTAIGAVRHDASSLDKSRPLALFSRRLSQAERNYSTFDKKLLAIYAAADSKNS